MTQVSAKRLPYCLFAFDVISSIEGAGERIKQRSNGQQKQNIMAQTNEMKDRKLKV